MGKHITIKEGRICFLQKLHAYFIIRGYPAKRALSAMRKHNLDISESGMTQQTRIKSTTSLKIPQYWYATLSSWQFTHNAESKPRLIYKQNVIKEYFCKDLCKFDIQITTSYFISNIGPDTKSPLCCRHPPRVIDWKFSNNVIYYLTLGDVRAKLN